MKQIGKYKADARTVLKDHWTQPVVATLLYLIIAIPISALIDSENYMALVGLLLDLLLVSPITYAFNQNFLLFKRNNETEMIDNLFNGFKEYGRAVILQLLYYIFILLWTLLLIIPGIIMMYAYRMIYYVAKDHPELSPKKCLNLSEDIMYGHKGQLFLLDLSFIGWYLIGLVTFGIGFLWIIPYMETSYAQFYEDAKAEYENGKQAKETNTEQTQTKETITEQSN